jgi:hypothetical protein
VETNDLLWACQCNTCSVCCKVQQHVHLLLECTYSILESISYSPFFLTPLPATDWTVSQLKRTTHCNH